MWALGHARGPPGPEGDEADGDISTLPFRDTPWSPLWKPGRLAQLEAQG